MFFSFILEISSKNLGSNNENPVSISENKLMTPSLLIEAFSNSLIRSLISFRESFLPSPVIRVSNVLTASK